MASPDKDGESYFVRHVFCCTNTRPPGHERGCCTEKDSVRLRNYLKARVKELGVERVRVNASGCLDRCELGPTMVIYPEGVWYRCRTVEDMEEVLQSHLVGGGRATHLVLNRDAEG